MLPDTNYAAQDHDYADDDGADAGNLRRLQEPLMRACRQKSLQPVVLNSL